MTTARFDRQPFNPLNKTHRRATQLIAFLLFICVGLVPAVEAQTAIANYNFTAGWATFGLALPAGAAANGVQVDGLPTQTDVKVRWPDGSIRFAVVSANIPAAGIYAIRSGAASSGSFTPALPAVSVTLTVNGQALVATSPSVVSDLWLSGPVVSEGRAVVAPGGHPFLRVNFDTRAYSDGKARVDVSVENVLDQSGATTVTYDAAIAINGQTVYTKPAIQHYYLTRWRKVFTVASTTLSSVTPDFTPFNQSQALPPYLSLVANEVTAPTGANYDVLREGALNTNMPAHGGRPELAPFPDWTARYIVHKDPTQRAMVFANGDLSGSWPIHVREAEGSATSGVGPDRLISIDQRPTVWLDSRAQGNGFSYIKGSPMPIREYGSLTPGPGQSPLIPDNAHQPSLAYVPYLITGDRYYLEEMAFWANYSLLRTYSPGRGAQGLLNGNEVRGIGWALRNMADAAAYYPDSGAAKTYFTQKVMNNLRDLDAYANAEDPVSNPFSILWTGKRPEGKNVIALWEQNYLAYGIDRANKQGFAGGLAHRDAIAKLQLSLFTSDPDWPRSKGAPYTITVGTLSGSTVTYFRTIGEMWRATNDNTQFAGYYGPEARINLMMGIERGWAGAQGAYDYLWPYIAVTPFWNGQPDLAHRAGWAIDFLRNAPPPPATPAQMSSPAPGSTFSSSGQTFNWTSGTGVSSYRLDLGNAAGATDIYAGVSTTQLSAAVSGLPTDGRTVWARLSSNISGSWSFADYSYKASTAQGLTIMNPGVTNVTTTGATVSWTTNVAANSRVDYGTSTAYGGWVADAAQVTNHSMALSGLSPSTTYHYRISGQTAAAASATTGDLTFSTAAASPPPPPPPPAPGGVVVDVKVASDGAGTRTTPAFSTSAPNEVLIAFAASDGPLTSKQTLTVSGAGLTWTLVKRANGQAGTAEIWKATAPAALANVTVTSTQLNSSFHQSLTVVAFKGTSGIGASAAGSAPASAPSISLVATKAGSLVWAIGHDWDRAVGRVVGTNQTLVRQWVDTSTGDTYWVQSWGSTVSAAGSTITLNVTSPTNDRWNFASVEIVP